MSLSSVTVSAATPNSKVLKFYDGERYLGKKTTTKKVTAPSAPTKQGYVYVGWDTSKKATKVVYKKGSIITPSKSMKLYAVYQKSYTVKFAIYVNSKRITYKTYTCASGSTITIPQFPEYMQYETPSTWKYITKNKTYLREPGKKVTVNKNLTFLAVYHKLYKVNLYTNTGRLIETEYVSSAKNEYMLPAMIDTNDYTVLGWGKKPYLKEGSDFYKFHETIKVTGDLNLYQVCYDRRNEKEVPIKNVVSYDHVIMTGESRTCHMQQLFESKHVSNNVTFVAKSGTGYAWYEETAHDEILRLVKENAAKNESTAVVFAFGVNNGNDVSYIPSYVKALIELSKEIKPYHAELYFVSINPLNPAQMNYYLRDEKQRKLFRYRRYNEQIKLQTKGYCKYIDTHDYLYKVGFAFVKNMTLIPNLSNNDGSHYTKLTNEKIWNYIADSLNAA